MNSTNLDSLRCRLPLLGALALLLVAPLGSRAAEIEGHPIDERLVLESAELDLYSATIKKATFMKVKVYAVGFYTEDTVSGPGDVDPAQTTSAFALTFLRDVGREKLAECFLSDLRKACGGDCDALLAQAASISNRLPDISEGDQVTYVLQSDRVQVLVNGASIGELRDTTAATIVLAAFVGEDAPKDLRKALSQPLDGLFASQID